MAKNATATPEREVIRFPASRFENSDVIIGVNGKLYQYQRGVDVEVPAEVAMAWRMSQESEDRALATERQLQRESKFN